MPVQLRLSAAQCPATTHAHLGVAQHSRAPLLVCPVPAAAALQGEEARRAIVRTLAQSAWSMPDIRTARGGSANAKADTGMLTVLNLSQQHTPVSEPHIA